MDYQEMKSNIRRKCVIQSGCNGETCEVGLCYNSASGCAIFVGLIECFLANQRIYQDEAEMLYYFDNHCEIHFPTVKQIL